ncbi:hypothetical protein [Flavisphingomonas formosensis]|uniref:hypothetical protein n=1 Tax=Flavisphingomonas formosensis TaxID=861534 RepID=UPI0012FCAC28|nr:hypothetical protein [Sphingomonas formosensis]
MLLAAALLAAAPALPPGRYATGQVWEYRTRASDQGSLLKIQKIDPDGPKGIGGPVYHVSVIGFRLANPRVPAVLSHAPLTKAALDASVTRLSPLRPTFPDAVPGIVQWQQGKGGVYSVPVARIIDMFDRTTRNMGRSRVGGEASCQLLSA